MDKFVSLDAKNKRAYFDVAAAKLNIMPQLIEKDFWVCWILKVLFSLPEVGGHLTFKGGTSLSKCYNVIKRFSEDLAKIRLMRLKMIIVRCSRCFLESRQRLIRS